VAKKLTPTQVLDIPMQPNDAEAETIREYLKNLLIEVWAEVEEFSGKRPFGNSGWENELYLALTNAEAIDATFDKDGYLKEFDKLLADELIFMAIYELT